MHTGAAVRAFARYLHDDTAMKPVNAAITLALAMTVMRQPARAAEWSYCVAPADAQNRIYISKTFPIRVAGAAEPGFSDALTGQGLSHDAVECARAENEATAVMMRQHAIDVNREGGRQVIDMPPVLGSN